MSPIFFQILLALADVERHGVGIMDDVLERTAGAMRLWPAMLYQNLQRLEAEQLIERADRPAARMAGRPRFYRITAAGRRACAAEARRLDAFVADARRKNLLKKGRL